MGKLAALQKEVRHLQTRLSEKNMKISELVKEKKTLQHQLAATQTRLAEARDELVVREKT